MVQPGPRTCPNCSRVVSAGHRFCENCGSPLPGAPAPARSRRNLLLALVAALAVAAVVVTAVLLTRPDDDPGDAAAGSTTAPASSSGGSSPSSQVSSAAPSPESPPAAGTVSCDYVPDDSGPAAIDVGTPPQASATPAEGTDVLVMSTGQGDLTLTLDRSVAPCAAASFRFLAEQGFFDGSPCHREVNEPTFGVLQCGDPTGTGTGGPAYRFDQEVTAATSYPRGTIAMANSGSDTTTGSQFFLCFVDTQLSPDYTVVGTVDPAGLSVLDGIAAAGNDGSFDPSPGGGAPAVPVVIQAMTVVG